MTWHLIFFVKHCIAPWFHGISGHFFASAIRRVIPGSHRGAIFDHISRLPNLPIGSENRLKSTFFGGDFCWWFRNPAVAPVEGKVVEIPLFTRVFHFFSNISGGWEWDFWTIHSLEKFSNDGTFSFKPSDISDYTLENERLEPENHLFLNRKNHRNQTSIDWIPC